VSTADSGIPKTKAKVTAFSISPDQHSLCTLDELYDLKSNIRVITLKFWSRTSADFAQFNLDQVTHLTNKTGMELDAPMSIEAISNTQFAVSLGNEDVRVWS